MNPSTKMRIGIVGAGVMGRLLALQFKSDDHEVSLFDRNSEFKGGSSYIAAGMLSPYCELENTEPLIHELGIESLEIWPNIIASLERESLQEQVFFQKEGTLVVAHPQDLSELERFRERIISKGGQRGFQNLSSTDITALEPSLHGRFFKGMYFSFEGQIQTQDFFRTTTQAMRNRGVKCFFETEVPSVDWTRRPQIGDTHFDWIVDCRGTYAQLDVSDLRTVRGELILVKAQSVHLHRPIRLMHPRYPLYLVPRPDQKFLIGATQIENDSTTPISVQSTLELLSAAYSIHPGFSEGQILENRVGLRPVFPNHLPSVRTSNHLIRVNGLYRHGYLIAPKLAELVFNFILNNPVELKYSSLFQKET